MTLYYDELKSKKPKDTYDMISARNFQVLGKDEVVFTTYIQADKKDETMTYKFDDQNMRNEWYYLVHAWKNIKPSAVSELHSRYHEKQSKQATLVKSFSIFSKPSDEDTILTRIPIQDGPTNEELVDHLLAILK